MVVWGVKHSEHRIKPTKEFEGTTAGAVGSKGAKYVHEMESDCFRPEAGIHWGLVLGTEHHSL